MFILMFYFSYEKIFTLKNKENYNFTDKITAITGLPKGLSRISDFIAWLIIELIKK